MIMKTKTIKKVAILGSGIMGSGIACHFANIGVPVLLLDIVPFNLTEEEKKVPAARNRIVNESLQNCIKGKLNPLYSKSFASRITTGNFDDDMAKIKDCDLKAVPKTSTRILSDCTSSIHRATCACWR